MGGDTAETHFPHMSLLDDRIAAIRRIEESVYSRLQEGRRPKLLATELFDLLRQAIERGVSKGGQLSRATAARDLDTTTSSTSFKASLDRIAEELQRCRPDDTREIPRAEDLPGVACVEAILEGVPHLVFVRGPRGSHRGDPNDALLRLEAEFRPVLARPNSPVVAEDETPALIEKAQSPPVGGRQHTDRPTARRSPMRLLWTGMAVVFVLATIWAIRVQQKPQPPGGRFFVLSIPAETDAYYDAYGGRIAPDGSRIAFPARARNSGKRFVFVRELGTEQANPIEDSEGDYTPFFWSHDSTSLYFVTGGLLKRKRIGQQAIQTIAHLEGVPRTVNRDGVVLLGSSKGILRVLPNGQISLTTISKDNESAHTAPYFLPDGVTFLFLAISHRPSGEVVKTLCSGRIDAPHRIRQIGPISSRVEWNADHLLYARDGALYARPWSLEKQSFAGHEVLVTRHVWSNALTSDADFSVARNGLLIVKDAASGSRFERIRPGTKPIPIPLQGQVVGVTVARDRELAVLASHVTPGRTDLEVWNLKDDSRRKLTSFGTSTSPVLDATGEEVYYAADRKSFASIYRMSIATGAETLVLAADSALNPRGISADGQLLLYASYRKLNSDLYCINLKTRRVIPIANSPTAMEGETGRFSPDGTQVVYVSDVSGEQRVYVTPFPPTGAHARLISPAGGWRARWSNDGEKIYYLLGRSVMEYDLPTHAVRELYRADSDISQMEPTSHGEFLVVIAPVEPANRIVSNWKDEVGRER